MDTSGRSIVRRFAAPLAAGLVAVTMSTSVLAAEEAASAQPGRASSGVSSARGPNAGSGMHQGHAMPMKCEGMQDCDRKMQQMHLSMLKTGEVDRNFAEMMVRHHEHGIEMARAQAANGKDAALRQQAQKILESQQKELAELRRWMQQKPGTRQSGPPSTR